MRRLTLALILCLFPCFAFAGSGFWPGPGLGKGGGAASCDPSTKEVGTRDVGATALSMIAHRMYLYAATSDCTGNLNTAYWYYDNSGTGSCDVYIYSRAGAAPDSADALVGGVTGISSGTGSEWRSSSTGVSGSVVNATGYWVYTICDAQMASKRGSAVSRYYKDGGTVGSPPATLGTGWADDGVKAPISAYISVGP